MAGPKLRLWVATNRFFVIITYTKKKKKHTVATRRDKPDYFSRRARHEQFVSRAVYKLADIDKRFRLLHPGQRVLDLGCAPGSWLQYLGSRVGNTGLVVGLDRQPVKVPVKPPVYFRQVDIAALDPHRLKTLTPAFDVVVSDLAPATSGIKDVDHQRSLELARLSWQYARVLLDEGGHYLVKVFEGPDFPGFVAEIRPHFQQVQIVKPEGSRSDSREIYLLARRRLKPPNDV